MGWKVKQIVLTLSILAVGLGVVLADIYLWRLVA